MSINRYPSPRPLGRPLVDRLKLPRLLIDIFPAPAVEATTLPGVGLVATVGQIPVVTGCVTPDVGAIRGQSWITGPVIYSEPEAINTHVPSLYTELNQGIGVGLVTTIGLIPVVTGVVFPGVGTTTAAGQIPDEYRELKQTIGLGLIATAGQVPAALKDGSISPAQGLVTTGALVPSLSTELKQPIGVGLGVIGGLVPTITSERVIAPGVGLAQTVGQIPSVLTDGAIGPTQGLATMGGLAPSLYLERLITPEVVPVVVIEGRLPTVTGDSGTPVVEATATPGVGLVTLAGTEPTLAVEYDKPRGHVTVKKRRSRNYGQLELSDSAQAVVTVPPSAYVTPDIIDPPHLDLVAADTGEIEAKITTLETRRSRLARMRREEEELIAILMRAA